MTTKFNPKQPFQTRKGFSVTHVTLKDKIMGIVKYDNTEAVFCVWSHQGEKISLYPRKNGEEHDLDLVNITENNTTSM
jgi:hypothetical protein